MHRRKPLARLSRPRIAVVSTVLLLFVGLLVPLGEQARADDAAGPTSSGIVSSVNGLWAVVDDLVSSPAVLDYDHPTLTVSGRLRLYDPVAKTYVAHSGGTASMWLQGGSKTAAIAEDGTFAVSVKAHSPLWDAQWTARLHWLPDAATLAAFGEAFPRPPRVATWTVPAVQSFWRLALDQTKITVKAPARPTVSGVVERQVGGVWTPQPNHEVLASSSATRTDANGRFSLTFPWSTDGDVKVIGGDYYTLFTNYESRPVDVVTLDVIPTSKLALSSTQVDPWRVFRARGRLTYDTGAAAPASHKVQLQRSANGKTGWTTLESIKTEPNGTFDWSVQLATVSGYYRVVFPGSSTVQASKSRAYTLSRRETRIGSFRLTPTKLQYGDSVTVRGVVQERTAAGTWVNLGKRVQIDLVRKASRDVNGGHQYMVKRWTRSNGAFSFTYRPRFDGYWAVIWRTGGTKLVHAVSPPVRVTFAQ